MDAAQLHKLWLKQQHRVRDEMRAARRITADHPRLGALVNKALDMYGAYYSARAELARADPVRFLAAPGATPLERAAYWTAGWRPNTLVHLIYSESGIRFLARLADLLSGAGTGDLRDLGDLSPAQIDLIDAVQRRTISEENAISDEMAEVQESVVDCFPPSDEDLRDRAAKLGPIIERADRLRMETLRALAEVLDPCQAVDLLVAAADLEIGIRGIGLEHERGRAEW